MIPNLGTKQVHLDFHTSEHIPEIGCAFSRDNFQEALKASGLDSITVFAKCHHGWCYYPTKVGNPHPGLGFNLLEEQIHAAHQIGVRAPIYIPIGWSANDAIEHPEWIARNRDGTSRHTGSSDKPCFDVRAKPDDPRPPVSWTNLYAHPSYVNYLVTLTEEICQKFHVDGLFFDIVFNPGGIDFSEQTLVGVAEAGLNPDDDADVIIFNERQKIRMAECLNSVLHRYHPQATVFYNGGAELNSPEAYGIQSHFELEDLPTFWGGYNKFPLKAKHFALRAEKPYLAMSGKFHTMWGEFGGFKHPDAITYEVAHSVAFGAGCSFGDQLHPSGRMEMATYRNIGCGYRYLDRIAPYGIGGSFYSDLGLLLSGRLKSDQGISNMLLEEHLEFEVIGGDADWSRFQTIIVPDGPLGDNAVQRKLENFLDSGGTVLALHKAGLTNDENAFALDCGADFLGIGRYLVDYSHASEMAIHDLPDAPFINYASAIRVALRGGSRSLGEIYEPYFDRTYATYCSHRNTPNQISPAEHPLGWHSGNLIYLAHPLGSMYEEYGARVHRQLFRNALNHIYRQPVIEASLPSTARISLRHQPAEKRFSLHLLFAPPIRRGCCEVIEDFPSLHDIDVLVRLPLAVTHVSLPLESRLLPFQDVDGTIRFTVPNIRMHQIVCLHTRSGDEKILPSPRT